MSGIDGDQRRMLAGQLRAIAGSGIALDDGDIVRLVMKVANGSVNYDSREFALALADLLDSPVSEPYVSKTSGRICCSICRKPLGDCGYPEVVKHCRSCGAKVDNRILMAIAAGRELAEELSDGRQRASF